MKNILKLALVLTIMLGASVSVSADQGNNSPYCSQPSCWEIA